MSDLVENPEDRFSRIAAHKNPLVKNELAHFCHLGKCMSALILGT